MKIETLIEQLEPRITVMRKYSNEEDYSIPNDDFKRYAEHLQKEENWLGHRPVFGKKTYEASDMARLGPGLQKELGVEWGVPLPEDYLTFCSKFDEYLFASGSFLVVNSAADVVESVISARQAVDMDLKSKHRLFHFATIIGIAGYFSFRWSENLDKMDIVFVWDYGDVGQYELLGESGDRFSSDSNFTSWLARLIETDGTPLFPGGRWPMADGGWFEGEYPYFKRLS
jgi:hypothetical protein